MTCSPLVQTFSFQGQPSIHFGTHLTDHIVNDLHVTLDLSKRQVVVISDDQVGPLYLSELVQAFQPHALKVLSYLLPAGENAKSLATKALLDTFLLTHGCTRTSVLVALGGGVVTDVVGFAAATYMRGITYVNVPTSLLGMVDASIGGKTGINHALGKNLIGNFHLPHRVYINTDYLSTLPERHFRNGLAEMIKAAVISEMSVFQHYLVRIDAQQHSQLHFLMQHAIQVKLNLVSMDLKESDVRAYLNYGHTIGHAIEWDTPDTLLHGECVAMGMVLEAKLAHWMGLLSLHEYHLIEQACLMQGLPTSLPSSIHSSLLLERMKLDKKTTHQLRIVLLKAIGKPTLLPVPWASVQWILSDACLLSPKPYFSSSSSSIAPREIVFDVPGSKSITNRALLLAALGHGTVTLTRVLHSVDTRVMLQALQKVGLCDVAFRPDNGVDITGHGGQYRLRDQTRVYLENAGTAVRFLTACLTLAPHPIVLDGDARMKLRPLAPLVHALNQNGCHIQSLSNQQQGAVPLRIHPATMKGGKVKLDAEVSSQYVSAILMCAPYAQTPVELELVGEKVVSEPYIQMTITMMRTFGIHVTQHSKFRYSIPLGTYTNPSTYAIEADASSATYPLALAALARDTTIVVPGLGSTSMQGDAEFSKRVLAPMGCRVEQTEAFTKVTSATTTTLRGLGHIDMSSMTDAFLTLAVLASVAAGTTVLTGIANQRIKECNRIHAVVTELQRLGVDANECADGLSVMGPTEAWRFHEVMCHNDHRMAMAFSLLALKTPLVIREKKCVEKTWPLFFETLTGTDYFRYTAYPVEKQRTSIVLIGMRGMGKSTLGAFAADQLGMYFIDLDTVFDCIHGPISLFVEKHGWSTFRQKETIILKSILLQYKKNCVIATGGGVIETLEAHQFLQTCGLHVVHVRRGWLPEASATKKPIFEASDLEVFHQRLPKYEAVDLEFVIPEQKLGIKSKYDWAKIQVAFVHFLQHLDNLAEIGAMKKHSTDTSVLTTGFVSLSASSIDEVLPQLDKVTQGVDAIELRLDLLHLSTLDNELLMHPVLHTFAHAIFTLKQVTALPILVTLRTQTQGGNFSSRYSKEFIHSILLKCIQWRVDILDVELSVENDWVPLLELKQKAMKNNVLLLPSYHDPKGCHPWSSPLWHDMVYKAKQINPNLIKLVSYAHSPSANSELMAFREKYKDISQLLLINMGWEGRLTRLLSAWTPVTHELLKQPTAAGQLTLRDLYRLQAATSMRPRKFHLFGDPIRASPSPFMHSKAFSYFGLDSVYTYTACAGPEDVVAEAIKQPEMGGASVTIPHKRTVCRYVDEVDADVQVMGAANTLYLRNGRWVAANTDWKAIHARVAALGCVRSACVLGAGGTARAAVYALSQLHPPPSVLYLCNRTLANATSLVADFQELLHGIEVVTLSLDVGKIQALHPNVLINTLPHLALPSFPGGLPSTHVIELGYQPDCTSLMKERPVKSITHGWELLVEQGILQFQLWTGLVPPREVMEAAVKEFFALHLNTKMGSVFLVE